MASFIPRSVFHSLESLPRAYFLGHHKAGLDSMKAMLSQIDLIIECRDYRVPLTSRNPLFEESLAGRERLIVYTKRDLVYNKRAQDREREDLIRRWQAPTSVIFYDYSDRSSVRRILDFVRVHARARASLTDSRMMVVGMPNVGKSSLLNVLRNVELHKGKAASTGAQPGITRKIGNVVKIIEGVNGGEGVYLADTPGVFIPYVPNDESMLKLALCGSVKDGIISPTILADYLLYQLNNHDPSSYEDYCPPTNDVSHFILAIAKRTGRLQKGGIPNEEASALWIIQQWRTGHLGRFVLDKITQENFEIDQRNSQQKEKSYSQAVRENKELKKQRARQRLLGGAAS